VLECLEYVRLIETKHPATSPHSVRVITKLHFAISAQRSFEVIYFGAEPALANLRPCPNFPPFTSTPPVPLFPFPSPSLSHVSPFRRDATPLKPARGLGERCYLPSGVRGEPLPPSHFAALCACKTHLAAFLILLPALKWVTKWKPIQAQVESGISLYPKCSYTMKFELYFS